METLCTVCPHLLHYGTCLPVPPPPPTARSLSLSHLFQVEVRKFKFSLLQVAFWGRIQTANTPPNYLTFLPDINLFCRVCCVLRQGGGVGVAGWQVGVAASRCTGRHANRPPYSCQTSIRCQHVRGGNFTAALRGVRLCKPHIHRLMKSLYKQRRRETEKGRKVL